MDGTRLAGAATVGAATYQPRAAEGTVLHRVVRDHLETFLREVADRTDGGGLPRLWNDRCQSCVGRVRRWSLRRKHRGWSGRRTTQDSRRRVTLIFAGCAEGSTPSRMTVLRREKPLSSNAC